MYGVRRHWQWVPGVVLVVASVAVGSLLALTGWLSALYW